jgi:putative transcriptional regulator
VNLLKNRLVECLEAKKLNQSWLARRLGMSRAYVSRLASGKIQPSMTVAFRIARCLGKPIEEIFQLADENKSSDSKNNFPTATPSAAGESTKPAENNKPKKGN